MTKKTARRARELPAVEYFESPAAFRRWLATHHETRDELVVGFHKRHTGRPTLSWPESVDEALCFGWIDGIRRSVDAERYTIRFTPRRPRSHWSLVNITRVGVLQQEGRMHPAGMRAFDARQNEPVGVYSYERAHAAFEPAELRRFKANTYAWRFWQKQPPGYRKVATFYVVSAKRPETRARRLTTLIDDSAAELRIGLLRRPEKRP